MCFFFFPQSSQLYYDANTGMYYYYDTESGKYQFHSRIEVPTAHPKWSRRTEEDQRLEKQEVGEEHR